MSSIKSLLFKNENQKQTIVKNVVWLFTGEILGRLLKLALILYATRALGVAGFGVFSYALAFVAIFYTFGDVGINTFVTRELSKDTSDENQYLPTSLVLKLFLLGASFIVSIIVIPHFGTVTVGLRLVAALSLLNFSDSIREFFFSINRAYEKMEREALLKILMNFVITVLGIGLLVVKATPLSLAIAYAVGSLVATIGTLFTISHAFKSGRKKFRLATANEILKFAWPFFAITIFSTLIANVDTIMLGQLKSAFDVGIYSAAQRIIQFLSIIPIFVGMATFPLMSKQISDPEAMARVLEKSLVAVCVIGLPITVGGMLLGTPSMNLLFGKAYAVGGSVLAILMVSVIFFFLNIILTNAIFAKNLQKKFMIATIVGTVANVAINFCLIPHLGAVGAAISTVAAEVLITAVNWIMLKKALNFTIISKLGKIAAATCAMTAMIVICDSARAPFIATVIIAIAVYLGILFLLQEPSLVEAMLLLKRS